jgi:copper(I)-binding protein
MKHLKLLLVALLLLGVVACSSAEEGKLEVLDAWGRTSPMVAQNGAFYMQIANNTDTDDKLLSAATEACDVVELHEMYMKENDVMGMRPVPDGYIALPAGETVELKAGGLHVMCIGKTADFNAGDTYPLTLQFENAGDMEVTVEIRDNADMPMDSGSMDMEEGSMGNDGAMEMESGNEG